MKKYLSVLVCLITMSLLGQEEVLSFQNLDFKRQLKNIENYSLSNSKTKDLAIILGQNENIKGYLFDANFEKIGEANGTHLDGKYKETIGYTIDENTYTLVFTTDSKKKFGYVSLDLKNKVSETRELDFEFDEEIYLESIVFDNRMIMLCATKDNELTLREFTQDFTFENVATFQLDSEDKEQRLVKGRFFDFDLFGSFENTTGGVTKIDTRVPNTIDRTSSENKLYHQGDKVYITFEDEKEQTIVNTINLTDLTLKTTSFPYPNGKIDKFKNYNSFIYKDNFFHIASSRDEMIFQVKDFNNTVLKEYYVDRDSDIYFKNSPIIQDGSNYGRGKRNLEETKQYLRKITSGNIGLAIHEENGNYQVSLGSHTKIQSGGGGSGGFPGAPMGGTNLPIGNGNSVFVPAYNPTFASYGGYGFSKAVYVNGLFDKQFNHIKNAEVIDNIFDRIKEYEDELKWDTGSDVFIHNGTTFYSYWNTKEQRYTLLQF